MSSLTTAVTELLSGNSFCTIGVLVLLLASPSYCYVLLMVPGHPFTAFPHMVYTAHTLHSAEPTPGDTVQPKLLSRSLPASVGVLFNPPAGIL